MLFRSLLASLSGEAHEPREFPPFETRWPERFVGSALVSHPWKLIWVESNYDGWTDRALLFDLARDPLERRDLSGEHPDVVAQLKQALEARHAAVTGALPAGPAEPMDETVLEALGY